MLYILFSFIPGAPEVNFTPEWTRDILRAPSPAASPSAVIPFSLGHSVGFFSPEGDILSRADAPFKATVSDTYYATYAADAPGTVFFNPDGSEAGTISAPGFPFFQRDRLYVMLPGGTSFARYSPSGDLLWRYEHYSPITAFSSSRTATVAGFADGEVVSHLNDGTLDQRFSPGGSDYEVILGVDVSDDGSSIACVSGQDDQRFLVAQKSGDLSKVIFHEYVEDPVVRQTLVRFSPDSDAVFYDTANTLGVHIISRNQTAHIPVSGRTVQVECMDDDTLSSPLAFALSLDGDTYTINVLESYVYPLASFSFKGTCAFIQVRGTALYVGRDTKISKITVGRR